MKPDIESCQDHLVSHHEVSNPGRIDVGQDEIVYIHCIEVSPNGEFWLEYHSATESRLMEGSAIKPDSMESEIVTRHKGNVYFTKSSEYTFKAYYVKLKIIS